MIQAIAFYLFATMVIASGVLTIMSRNPVHSVLWLILAFFNAAGLMVLVGAEFIAALLVIVYVGAVAVLFLFVVMMLDVDFAELKAEMARYMPLALLIGLVILMQFVMAFGAWDANSAAEGLRTQVITDEVHNTAALGLILYDQYFLLFQLAGLILLVAMIGAIVLTHRDLKTTRGHQNITKQVRRNPKEATQMKQPTVGEGVEL